MYAALNRGGRGYNFRISVILTEEVDGGRLREAVISLAPRFPVMYSHLAKGFFTYYHIPATDFDVVTESEYPPPQLHEIIDTEKPSFAVNYCRNRITLTVFHANGDGSAGATFLRSLVTRYFELGGLSCSQCPGVLRVGEAPDEDELRDEYTRLRKRGKHLSLNESTAFVLRTEYTPGLSRSITMKISLKDLKSYTKPRGLTATEYMLTAVYAAICKYYDTEKDTLPVKPSVPIDLRNVFPCRTLRNFALYTNLELYPTGTNDFDSDAAQISRQLKAGLDRDRLIALASTNVALEKSIIVRLAPRAVRDFFLQRGYKILGAAKITTTLSNIGLQVLAPELDDKVDRFEMFLGSGRGGVNFAAAGYKDALSLCISLSGEDNTIPDTISDILNEHHIAAEVYETRRQLYVN